VDLLETYVFLSHILRPTKEVGNGVFELGHHLGVGALEVSAVE
jgi:hypothetical protein